MLILDLKLGKLFAALVDALFFTFLMFVFN